MSDSCSDPASGGAELFHVGLTVDDLDASLVFYTEVVGMEVTERIHRRSKHFDELMANAGQTEVKVAYLALGPFCLQLIEYVTGGGDRLRLGHDKAGNPHLCFYVADANATYDRIVARGDVRVTSHVVQVAPTMLSFYTVDPTGVPVEFLQRTPPVEHWAGSVDVEE